MGNWQVHILRAVAAGCYGARKLRNAPAEARARKRFEQIRNGDAARRSATVQHRDNTILLKERDRSPSKEDDMC
jgi:hypothetical protein